jgi:hypothetical protein
VLGLAVLAGALVLAAPGQRPAFEFFRMPSGNIGCAYAARGATLRCDILSGLRPEPRGRCELDWTGLTVAATGRARPQCAGDTAVDLRSPVLRYGRTWRRGGITCRSATTGLRCSNRAGHGFFLSRARWRLF